MLCNMGRAFSSSLNGDNRSKKLALLINPTCHHVQSRSRRRNPGIELALASGTTGLSTVRSWVSFEPQPLQEAVGKGTRLARGQPIAWCRLLQKQGSSTPLPVLPVPSDL